MKRWLLGLFVALLASPSLALAVQPRGPDWVPIEHWPIAGRPTLPNPSVRPGGATFAYDAEALRGAQYLGPAHLFAVGVNVAMQMRDESSLLRYAALVSDPHSLYYRHFLTPRQLGDFFGASRPDYVRAIQYFWSQGLAVRWWKQRQTLRVIGPQANMERAFGTQFGSFMKNGTLFYAPVNAPHFAIPLAVSGVGGLVTYHRLRRHIVIGAPFRPAIGLGPGFLFGNSPFDLEAAFDYTSAYNVNATCCKGDGITIGIVGTGPISSGDVPFFRLLFNVQATGAVNQVNVTNAVFNPPSHVACCYSTGLQTPPPVSTTLCSGGLPSCNPEDAEAQLDTEQSSSLAPNATVSFYLAYNPNECYSSGPCSPGAGSPQLGIGELDDELQQIINDNTADVVSASYGIGESDFALPGNPLLDNTGHGAEPMIFASLVAEGIAVFVSSGDSGAEGCQPDGGPNADLLCVSYPSSDPNVISAGGTTTPIQSNGRLAGLITTWGVQTQGGGAGGGGFSAVFPRPGYQPAGSMCADNLQCDSSHRLLPDVSLNSDPITGDALICGAGPGGTGVNCVNQVVGPAIASIGGTSAAAPGMAAMWALVLEACKQTVSCHKGPSGHPYRLGNPAPLLYALSPTQRSAAFYDIVYGNNAVPVSGSNYPNVDPGFNAGVGWDAATGLGAPFARSLIKAIVGI